mmetsp:Transcript_42484/g.112094  ORF Transcript_42484/g.112094 Transcript_42484/m.112094 type:complete len:393 (+) Transcript_42484:121-1299(+)
MLLARKPAHWFSAIPDSSRSETWPTLSRSMSSATHVYRTATVCGVEEVATTTVRGARGHVFRGCQLRSPPIPPKTTRPFDCNCGTSLCRIRMAFTRPSPPSFLRSSVRRAALYLTSASIATSRTSTLSMWADIAALTNSTAVEYLKPAASWLCSGHDTPLAQALMPFICTNASPGCVSMAISIRFIPWEVAKCFKPSQLWPTTADIASMAATCTSLLGRNWSIRRIARSSASPLMSSTPRSTRSMEIFLTSRNHRAALSASLVSVDPAEQMAAPALAGSTTSFVISWSMSLQGVSMLVSLCRCVHAPSTRPSSLPPSSATIRANVSQAFRPTSFGSDMPENRRAKTGAIASLFIAVGVSYATLHSIRKSASRTFASPGCSLPRRKANSTASD